MPETDLSKLAIDKTSARSGRNRGGRKAIIAAIVLLVLIAIFAAKRLFFPVVTVETVTVSRIYPSQSFTVLNASGYVVAQRKAAVAPKTTGQLEWLGVEEGSRVTGGQVLARLENRDVTAGRDQAAAALAASRFNLEQARTELTDATRAFRRAKELVAAGVVSQADFDTAEARIDRARASVSAQEAAVRSADASLAAADAAVGYTVIRAPFDAVVLTKNADIGDIVTPIGAAANAKAAVVTIADLGSLQVEADVSESNLARVKVGQPCEIQLDALPDRRFRGTVHTIVPTADRSKASVMVKVRFLDSMSGILPEMSAKVAFLEREVTPGEQTPRPAVPRESVLERNGRKRVFVVTDNLAHETEITVGNPLGDFLEVTGGVTPGQVIVRKPPAKLQDKGRVKLAEKK